jgi:hypothetical protein
MRTILIAGVISGYAATALQLTNGAHGLIKRARDTYTSAIDRKADSVVTGEESDADTEEQHRRKATNVRTWKELATCGWCIAPYVTVPAYIVTASALRDKQRLSAHLVGVAAASAVAAFLRHFSNIY